VTLRATWVEILVETASSFHGLDSLPDSPTCLLLLPSILRFHFSLLWKLTISITSTPHSHPQRTSSIHYNLRPLSSSHLLHYPSRRHPSALPLLPHTQRTSSIHIAHPSTRASSSSHLLASILSISFSLCLCAFCVVVAFVAVPRLAFQLPLLQHHHRHFYLSLTLLTSLVLAITGWLVHFGTPGRRLRLCGREIID
jgi:hypothetical protein